MQPITTNLDAATVALTLTQAERTAILDNLSELPKSLVESLRQQQVRRDRIRVSPNDLELLDAHLGTPLARAVSREARTLLKGVREQIADELNLLNAKTSSVAVDNAAHTLYKTSLRNKSEITLDDAHAQLIKLRALPLRLREFKLTAKDKRLLQQCGLPKATLARIKGDAPNINLADVMVILAARYRFDRSSQPVLLEGLLDFRSRISEYLDQESRRTVQINRQRALKNQQEWRRDYTR